MPQDTPMKALFSTHSMIRAVAASAVALITVSGGAQIYSPQGGGQALDANTGTGSRGINTQVPTNQINTSLNNDIVTGNVTGGRGLRVDVGYSAPGSLGVTLQSDSLFDFNANASGGNASYYNSYTNPTARFSASGISRSTPSFYSGGTYVRPSANFAGAGPISYTSAIDRGAATGLTQRPIAGGFANFNTTAAANELNNAGITNNPLAARLRQRAMTNLDNGNPYVSKYLQQGSSATPNNAYESRQTPTTLNPEFTDPRLSTLSLGASLNQYRRLNPETETAAPARGPQQNTGDTSFGTAGPQRSLGTPESDTGNQTPFGQDPNFTPAPENTEGGSSGPSPAPSPNTTPALPPNDAANRTNDRLQQMILGQSGPDALNAIQGDTAYRQLLDQLLNPNAPEPQTEAPNTAPGLDWRNPSQERLDRAADRLSTTRQRAGTAGTDLATLGQQNPELADMIDRLNYDLPAIRTLAGQTESQAAELLKQAEAQMSEGQYFDAERTYQRVQTLKPEDPMIRVGRIHALLGAGMIRSSALQLRRLFEAHPELIAAKYEEPLLPNNQQLLRVQSDLTTLSDTRDAANAAGIMLAYIGYQKQSKTLMRYGLSVAEAAAPTDALIPVLQQIWLEDAQ